MKENGMKPIRKKPLGIHILKGTGIGSIPNGKWYGVAFDKSNSWMSFSHVTIKHLWMMIRQPFIKAKRT
jgi:hypothetical protein